MLVVWWIVFVVGVVIWCVVRFVNVGVGCW